jgi:hypothetical protein
MPASSQARMGPTVARTLARNRAERIAEIRAGWRTAGGIWLGRRRCTWNN